jgi:hypothetical protein
MTTKTHDDEQQELLPAAEPPARPAPRAAISDIDRLLRATRSGMVHWAGTGPQGTTCGGCAHFGYTVPLRNGLGEIVSTDEKSRSCWRFWQLMRQHGAALPASTPSCRHFAPKP